MRIATNIYVCVNLAYLRISRAVRSKRAQRSQTSRHHLSFLARPALYLPTDLRALTCLLPWLYRDLLLLLVYTLSRSRRATRETTGPRIALIAVPYDVLFLATGAMGAMAILAIRFVRQALKAWRWDPSDGSSCSSQRKFAEIQNEILNGNWIVHSFFLTSKVGHRFNCYVQWLYFLPDEHRSLIRCVVWAWFRFSSFFRSCGLKSFSLWSNVNCLSQWSFILFASLL